MITASILDLKKVYKQGSKIQGESLIYYIYEFMRQILANELLSEAPVIEDKQ